MATIIDPDPLGAHTRRVGPTRTRQLALAVGLALVTACGGDGDATRATPDPDSTPVTGSDAHTCELIALDAVSELFGIEASVDDELTQPVGGRQCAWAAEVRSGAGDLPTESHLLQLQVQQGRAFFDPETWGDDPTEVDGIGEDAFVVEDSIGGGVTAGFVDGDTVGFLTYSVLYGDADPAERTAEVVELLRAVSARV
jgi:hypothetical protein